MPTGRRAWQSATAASCVAERGTASAAAIWGLLEAGQPEPLGDYLCELPMRQAGHGFFQGKVTSEATTGDPAAERRRLVWIMDSLCGLAEALGVLGVDCPEGQPTIPCPPPSVEELVARIEEATGLSPAVPDICAGLFGLASGDRVIHVRSACAVYEVDPGFRAP